MKFVITSNGKIPGYGGIKGPILTPQEIPLKKVLDMVSSGFEVFEVMEDGSHRKVQFSDERIINEMIREKRKKETPKVNVSVKFKDDSFLKKADEELDQIVADIDNKKIDINKNSYESKKSIKKDKKNNDNKSELPIVDKVEKISDDK